MPFSTIIGHERIVDILQRALAAKRIAHAYLFAGPEGCGKQTTALALLEAAWRVIFLTNANIRGGPIGTGSSPAYGLQPV